MPVRIEDLEDAPQLCLVDTGATVKRFGIWLARARGVDLPGARERRWRSAAAVRARSIPAPT